MLVKSKEAFGTRCLKVSSLLRTRWMTRRVLKEEAAAASIGILDSTTRYLHGKVRELTITITISSPRPAQPGSEIKVVESIIYARRLSGPVWFYTGRWTWKFHPSTSTHSADGHG
jgi:hypothetical protein